MAATVDLYEWNGTSGSQASTTKTSSTIRFKVADNSTVDNNNPMVKPPSGTNWSFQKYIRMHFTVAPAGQITAPVVYMDGTESNTGVTQYIKTTNPGSYATPAQETATTGYTDMFTYTSGSPKAIDAVNAGPFTGTGDKGDFMEMALAITSTVAAPGPLTGETLTIAWNET